MGLVAKLAASRRAATEPAVSRVLDEATLLRGQATAAATGDLSKSTEAHAIAEQARSLSSLVTVNGFPRVELLLSQIGAEHAAATKRAAEATRDQKFLERLEAIRLERFVQGDKWSPSVGDEAYQNAFRDFGIDVNQLGPAEAGRQVKYMCRTSWSWPSSSMIGRRFVSKPETMAVRTTQARGDD